MITVQHDPVRALRTGSLGGGRGVEHGPCFVVQADNLGVFSQQPIFNASGGPGHGENRTLALVLRSLSQGQAAHDVPGPHPLAGIGTHH